MAGLHLAAFRVDATVPLGHPLCGGWIKSAEKILDPLYALGVVLLGEQAPVVLCAVDWTGVLNEAHQYFRLKLAEAAHTTPERVALHAVHQHNAPFIDLAAQKLVAEQKNLPQIMDRAWFEQTAERIAKATKNALGQLKQVTHISWGKARVDQVASNRRLIGADGKLRAWRASACKDPQLRAEPEGLIDPWLKSVSFWSNETKLAALHYYATHPMSYYGDGIVTSDFVGMARERRAKEDGVPHLYFTGCAGNIAAGKYNDGSSKNRSVLAERVYRALKESEERPHREAATSFAWHCIPIVLPPRSDATESDLLQLLRDESISASVRIRSAMKLSYRRRATSIFPIQLSCLRLGGKVRLLHLPGESFVEYQLHAQQQNTNEFVCTAAYGDDGPWYVPLDRSYAEGGYEPSASFVDPSENLLKSAIVKLTTG